MLKSNDSFEDKMAAETKAAREVERIRKNRSVLERWLKTQEESSSELKTSERLSRSRPGMKIGSRPWHNIKEGKVIGHQVLGDGSQAKHHEPRYNLIPNPKNALRLKEFLRSTTARLGVWRSGVRPKTKVMLDALADHAIAKRAVYEEFSSERAKNMGCVEITTRVHDKAEFLLRPDLGRELSPESAQFLKANVEPNPDVQIVISDGLSGISLEVNIEKLLPLLKQALSVKGYKVGTPIYCRFARVTLQDRIAEVTGAKVSIILIGERPGLGTGDGLSAYIIYSPTSSSTHANRNCISNIHPRGLADKEAAQYIEFVVTQMFEQKTSGVELNIG
jgi:ethanolamine ammonia-lyase small subunit